MKLEVRMLITCCHEMPSGNIKISTAKLEQLIEASDKSMPILAAELGVTVAAIYSWLNQDPSAGVYKRTFQRMLVVFGVRPEELKAESALPVLSPKILAELQRRAELRAMPLAEYVGYLIGLDDRRIRQVGPNDVGSTDDPPAASAVPKPVPPPKQTGAETRSPKRRTRSKSSAGRGR